MALIFNCKLKIKQTLIVRSGNICHGSLSFENVFMLKLFYYSEETTRWHRLNNEAYTTNCHPQNQRKLCSIEAPRWLSFTVSPLLSWPWKENPFAISHALRDQTLNRALMHVDALLHPHPVLPHTDSFSRTPFLSNSPYLLFIFSILFIPWSVPVIRFSACDTERATITLRLRSAVDEYRLLTLLGTTCW